MKLHLGGFFPGYPHTAPRRLEVELTSPATLEEVLARLGIPLAEVQLIAINGELVEAASALIQPDDAVSIYPAMDGG